jgi:phosphoribosylaminoimidazole-succinocarboxamide synthase
MAKTNKLPVLYETNLKGLETPKRGKVRDIYDLGENLLIVATDRVSAFDVVLPTPIPFKGRVLNQLSLFWFDLMKDIIENHVVESDVEKYPKSLKIYANILRGRSMIVRKAIPVPAECVVRGYLAGSGWKDYKNGHPICGVTLTSGLFESSKLEEAIFTPTTKAEEGHDLSLTFAKLANLVGIGTAQKLRGNTIRIYERARKIAYDRNIIIADTKFEFGMIDGKLKVIDEILTPDSSRFWPLNTYKPGKSQESYDKQFLRDYLETLDWDKTYPSPEIPAWVVSKTTNKYLEAFRLLTGRILQ